jgi:hypothetical protein
VKRAIVQTYLSLLLRERVPVDRECQAVVEGRERPSHHIHHTRLIIPIFLLAVNGETHIPMLLQPNIRDSALLSASPPDYSGHFLQLLVEPEPGL